MNYLAYYLVRGVEQVDVKSSFAGPDFFIKECETFEKMIEEKNMLQDFTTFVSMHVHAKEHKLARAKQLLLAWYCKMNVHPPSMLWSANDLEIIVRFFERTNKEEEAKFYREVLEARANQ